MRLGFYWQVWCWLWVDGGGFGCIDGGGGWMRVLILVGLVVVVVVGWVGFGFSGGVGGGLVVEAMGCVGGRISLFLGLVVVVFVGWWWVI